MHVGHRVAMKLTHTGLPFSEAGAIYPPPIFGTTSGGAGGPTPNASAADVAEAPGEAPGEAGTGGGEVTGDGEADATGLGEAAGVAAGSAVGAVVAAGRYATSPPTISPPTTRPERSPSAIAVFPPIWRERTSTNGWEAVCPVVD